MIKNLIIFALILFSIHSSVAGILTVKQDGSGDYTTIQAAISAAVWNSGDTILVWPGVYTENIEYNGKHLTIASLYITQSDPWYIHNTIIDGNNAGICVLMNGGNDVMSIEGLTIRNGETSSGYGGLRIHHATSMVANCIIEKNNGFGIHIGYSQLNIEGTTIRYNYSKVGGGGIIFIAEAYAYFDTVNPCSIYMNYGPYGSDIMKSGYSSPQTIYLDTLTVMDPDFSFVASYDIDNLPVDDIDLTVEHGYIQPVNSDLYVNPVTGNDSNSGINPGDPLKTITYAYKIIKSDSITPHRIYLANGTYSGSMNGEKLPLGPRSYISVIGSGIDSTFIDGEYNTGFFLGIGTLKNYTIENITFQHGKWNHPSGIYIQNNNFVRIKNFEIKDGGYSASGGITLIKIDLLILKNIFIKNIVSYGVLGLSNWAATTKTFTIENCIIQNNLPDEDPINTGLEGGLKIGGNSSPPYSYIGKITNLQITDNLRIPDPGWGPGMIGGYTQSNYCKVDMINATIGYNTVQGEFGFAANANNGAELNVYNSIFYGDSLNELSLGYQNCPVPSEANISYSNFEGGFGNTYVWDNSELNWLDGNIDENPKWDTASAVPYSLKWDSPCIDAGTPMYEFGMDYPYIKIEDEKIVLYKIDGDTIHLPQTDIAGNPRIVNGRIDMGAYEFQDTGVRIREQFLQNLKELNIDVFPNPFHSHTFISFVLVKKADVKVLIHDARGSVVKSLLDGSLSSGKYNLTWPGQDDSGNEAENGAYLVSVYVDGIKMGSEKVVKNSSR